MIVFDPLWETMKRRGISQYALIKEHGVSTGTLDALRKNRSITLNTLNDLCRILRCDVADVIRYIPEYPAAEWPRDGRRCCRRSC